MPQQDDNLLRRLLATFKPEAREHIDAIASGLLELERAPDSHAQSIVLDTTFRAAHSLKGAARTVNVRDIEALCQSLENVFAALRRKDVELSAELFDLLHRVVAMLGALLQATDGESPSTARPSIVELLRLLQAATLKSFSHAAAPVQTPAADTAYPTGSAVPSKRQATDTVRVATAKLDAVLLQAEELLAAKLAATQQAMRLRRFRSEPVEWKKRWRTLRPDVRSIRRSLERAGAEADGHANPQLQRVMDFLDWSRDCIESLDSGLLEVVKAADHDQRSMGAMVDNLLDEMKKVVMQPFATLLDMLPRMVRELSREQGKLIELSVDGDEIEIDRRILEEMKDPLIHLMRNCVDHGIETPDQRAAAGKPGQGALTIAVAARDGSNVELVVADDGAGISAATVKSAALKLATISSGQAAALSDADAISLIFQSGVSTSPLITDLSGRGLGLAIVKEKVEKLRGSLCVETEVGRGTKFRIILPLTLARFRGVVVRVARNLFVLPTSNVERVLRVRKADIKTVENRETIMVDAQVVALAHTIDILELPRPPDPGEPSAHCLVVVLTHGQRRIAFLIDEVLNEQEVLVKRLGKQLTRVRNVVGATVLGTGQVVPILNVPDLIESAVAGNGVVARPGAAAPQASAKKQSVLVAEDSITSRILIKNILETAGYRVETAVDGVDGLTKLRSGDFDLVVSDVEMPRMDGFGLTAQVRADKKLGELPVILVTALDSREDRERGVDAGANAYIVKSSFDQSNLLEVVRRLI